MEYDPKLGERLNPRTTDWVAGLVRRRGFDHAISRMPSFEKPLAAEVGSPHTQECVERQRETLWRLYARRVMSEKAAVARDDVGLLVKIPDARFQCFCEGEEHMLQGRVQYADSCWRRGAWDVWVSWRRILPWEEGEIDLDDVTPVEDYRDESPDAMCERVMAELRRRDGACRLVAEGEGEEEEGEEETGGESGVSRKRKDAEGEDEGEIKKRKVEGM